MKLIFSRPLLICGFGALLGIQQPAYAQNDNPTGKAGVFNGNSNTGGVSYDPYTSNATRTLVDLAVPGAVGTYGLRWTRTMNTRHIDGPTYNLGTAGSWQHAYNWGIDWMAAVEGGDESIVYRVPGPARPISYTVYYPDGRVVEFEQRPNSTDPVYRGPTGVTDRFQSVVGDGLCYLLLSDGGKVQFHQTAWLPAGTTEWQFSITPYAVIDPYGLSTTLTYAGPSGQLSQVTEPAGRWLKINYITAFGDQVIGSVQAGYGVNTVTQSVTYSYQQFSAGPYNYTTLTGAAYSDGTGAAYTYQPANTYPGTAPPLIRTCDDVRYPGPMKKVAYEFVTQPGENQGGIYGEFATARKWLYPAPFVVTYGLWSHTEQRGDGPLRTFTYGPADPTDENNAACVQQPYLLSAYTDFKGIPTKFCYDNNGFLNGVWDANTNLTSFTRTSLTGKLLTITHPADATGVYSTIRFSYADPVTAYYLQSVTDELQHTTIYQRDSNNRIKEIDYPDTASETFIYNSLGQVTTHRMTSGGTETFEYDGRGLRQAYRDPYHQAGNATARYQYDVMDRISGITDPRGNYTGDPNYTTNYEYNQRGQLTKTTHPIDPVTAARYTVINAYNDDGTVRDVTDERGNVTSYGYDDYKRLSSVTAPPAFAGDALPRITYLYYDKTGGTGTDYTHSDANVTNVTTPLGNTAKRLYDENLWKRLVTVGTGAEAATTSFTYDFVGNLKTIKDPNGQSTNNYTEYFYDKRDRLTDVNDPIAADRNSLGHTVSWTYDLAGNKKSQLRANNQLVTYDQYDAMNRLQAQSVQRDTATIDQTAMMYDSAGNLSTFTDGRQKQYTYRYDFLNRRIATVYPADDGGSSREEGYHYDLANNMDTFTDRGGAIQTFEYDNRNRQTHYYWSTWAYNTIHERWLSYDPVGNVLQVRTAGYDVSDFIYDFRNRKTSEAETWGLSYPRRTVSYTYDADSNRKTLTYPSGYQLTYNYNTRNQLREEVDSSGSIVTYAYDLSGNRTRRDLRNGTFTQYYPDSLNRIGTLRNFRGSNEFGRLDYGYDKVSRIAWVKRGGVEQGDKYDYYLDDQLKDAYFEAFRPDGTPFGAANSTALAYDANGNRTSQTNTATPSYSYSVNDLNQYTSVSGSSPGYDSKGNLSYYNGTNYTYNQQNRLGSVENGSNPLYFYYDGLGRQILRYEAGEWIYSIWDGWDLLEEYRQSDLSFVYSYVHGAATDEMVQRFDTATGANRIWYYQDAQGSTTYLADDSGNIIEKYKYDSALSGAPSVFNVSDQQRASSAYDNRFLYTGREYYKEGGLYDYRNRSYLPSLGRFLQPDPIGFSGDANLYRYCSNNPVNRRDPTGLQDLPFFENPTSQAYQDFRNAAIVNYVTQQSAGVTAVNNYLSTLNSVQAVVGSPEYRLTFGIVQASSGVVTFADSAELVATPLEPLAGFGMALGIHEYTSGMEHISGAMRGEGFDVGPPFQLMPYPDFSALFGSGSFPAPIADPSYSIYSYNSAGELQVTVIGTGVTLPNAGGAGYHIGTNGTIISGNGFGVIGNIWLNLTSTGGGEWQTVGYTIPGGLPGEGTHPVPYDWQ